MANRILTDSGATRLPVALQPICRRYGWRLYSYRDGWAAIDRLGLLTDAAITNGFCTYTDGQYYIFFDGHLPPDRQRITIAHEMGHIAMHHIGAGECARNSTDHRLDMPEEMQAHQFAARLLAPTPVLLAHQLTTAEAIAAECKMPITAAKYRAREIGAILRSLNQTS